MVETVYVLCILSSIACALLLHRGARASRSKLLFWTGLCFAGLAVNSLLVLVDLLVVPGTDLTLIRTSAALVAMCVLIFGLVWEAR